MAFPPAETVPTTDARASVEIESPTLDPVDPASVDSGADIANRATGLATDGARTGSDAELRGALSGNETAFAVLETYYKDPIAAADRLGELNPAEQRQLADGGLNVLGELRPDAATQSAGGIDRDLVGPGLAAYSENRIHSASTFEVAETRELDRATGREPGLDPASPETDLEPTRDAGASPSTSGQGGGLGGFVASMNSAAQSGAGGGQQREMSVEQTMQRQAMSMSASL